MFVCMRGREKRIKVTENPLPYGCLVKNLNIMWVPPNNRYLESECLELILDLIRKIGLDLLDFFTGVLVQ